MNWFFFVLNLALCVLNASYLRDGHISWMGMIASLGSAFAAGWFGSQLVFKR